MQLQDVLTCAGLVIWKPRNYNWDCTQAKGFSESAEDFDVVKNKDL